MEMHITSILIGRFRVLKKMDVLYIVGKEILCRSHFTLELWAEIKCSGFRYENLKQKIRKTYKQGKKKEFKARFHNKFFNTTI